MADNALLLPLVALFSALVFALGPNEFWSDSWLAFLGGREIAAHGLPTHDTLTVWEHGRRWVDQQWLAQLAFYGAYTLGGARLALLLHGLAAGAAYGGAVAVGRACGGGVRGTFLAAAAGFLGFGGFVLVLRPQSLAYPLFVALFWLLARYSRGDTRRIRIVAPLLVLWANLHGSVVLGSLLILLAVLVEATRSRRLRRTEVGLIVASLVLPFASPYALHLPGYYREVLLNPSFGRFVTEWQPTTPSVITYPFYVIVVLTLLLLGRNGHALTRFEQLALLVLLTLAVKATRGIPWFCLAAMMTMPALLAGVLTKDYGRLRTRRIALVAGASALILLGSIASAFARPASRFDLNYPPAARDAIIAAAGHGKVYANEIYADWLLLVHPAFRGRIAFDARFELLSHAQLKNVTRVDVAQDGWQRILRPYRVAVLRSNVDLRRAMRNAGWKLVYHHAQIDVLRRPKE